MNLVQTANEKPYRCAVLPQVGNSNSKGFIDTNSYIDGIHIYVSVAAYEEMAKLMGYYPQADVNHLIACVEDRDHEIARLRKDVEGLNKELDAVEVLTQTRYQQRRRGGRKTAAELQES